MSFCPQLCLVFNHCNCRQYFFVSICVSTLRGGQSRGQHDWVHGCPEPVKSFLTFVILSQISCSKVQNKPSYFSAQVCVKVFPWVCCSFPDYVEQLKKERKNLRDRVHTSVVRINLKNCSKPKKTLRNLVQKNMRVLLHFTA